jgi:hypothetical protein
MEDQANGVLRADRATIRIDLRDFLHLIGPKENPRFSVRRLALTFYFELDNVRIPLLVKHLPLPGILFVLYRPVGLQLKREGI